MNTKRSPLGFGLIEVMVSAALLAIGMAGTSSLVANLQDNYKHQRLVSQGLHIAEATMEELLVRYADDSELAAGPHTGSSYGITGAPGGTYFAVGWVVTDAVPFAGTREIVVTISWSERGRPKQLAIRTVRT